MRKKSIETVKSQGLLGDECLNFGIYMVTDSQPGTKVTDNLYTI